MLSLMSSFFSSKYFVLTIFLLLLNKKEQHLKETKLHLNTLKLLKYTICKICGVLKHVPIQTLKHQNFMLVLEQHDVISFAIDLRLILLFLLLRFEIKAI